MSEIRGVVVVIAAPDSDAQSVINPRFITAGDLEIELIQPSYQVVSAEEIHTGKAGKMSDKCNDTVVVSSVLCDSSVD